MRIYVDWLARAITGRPARFEHANSLIVVGVVLGLVGCVKRAPPEIQLQDRLTYSRFLLFLSGYKCLSREGDRIFLSLHQF